MATSKQGRFANPASAYFDPPPESKEPPNKNGGAKKKPEPPTKQKRGTKKGAADDVQNAVQNDVQLAVQKAVHNTRRVAAQSQGDSPEQGSTTTLFARSTDIKSCRAELRLREGTFQQLHRLAKNNSLSLNEVIHRILDDYLSSKQ